MNNNNALAVRTDTMADWQVLRQQAEVLVKTGFLPQAVKTPEQALAIILTGRELGVGAMQALNTINVIAGKPTISPQLMLALINRSGELEDFAVEDDGQACTVLMKRRGRQPHVEVFSMKDAAMMKTTEYIGGDKKTISLSEKYNWKQQPAVMRKWRAIAACARVVFPDVILGLYTPDEMGAHTDAETGEVVEVAARRTPQYLDEITAEEVIEIGEIPLEKEPEPVLNVKLEGAQPTREQSGNKRHSILAYAEDVLKWTPEQLIAEIDQRFRIALNPAHLSAALESLPSLQLKELNQALKAEFENRNR